MYIIKLLVPCSLPVKGGNDGKEINNYLVEECHMGLLVNTSLSIFAFHFDFFFHVTRPFSTKIMGS